MPKMTKFDKAYCGIFYCVHGKCQNCPYEPVSDCIKHLMIDTLDVLDEVANVVNLGKEEPKEIKK